MDEQDKNKRYVQFNGYNDAKWGELSPDMLEAVVQALQCALGQAETAALDMLDQALNDDVQDRDADIPPVLEAIMAAYHKYN